MRSGLFEVIKPGLLTTIQDLGRTGFQQYGVVASGAMDTYALQISNILVGNNREEACLEIAHIGPELRILQDTVIAICGADLSPRLDGVQLPLWKSFRVKRGQVLSFGKPINGVYAYIAVANGINVEQVMGSKSTYTKAQLGGFHGRALKKGDILNGYNVDRLKKLVSGRGLSTNYIPNYQLNRRIKVVLGPDDTAFQDESIQTFLKEKYEVTKQSDRMGYRLNGKKLIHTKRADIISDAILPGTIQVSANGQPIILLADRQSVGGYTRIATVISTDLPYVAQKFPGEQISFTSVTVAEAQELYIKQEKLLRTLSVRNDGI